VRAFEPVRWLRNRHLQTIAASFPVRSGVPAERLVVALDDGDALIARAWWQPNRPARGTVLLVHGVGGDAESAPVMRAALACYRAGWHVVRLNLRGAGEGVATATSIYHAGLTSDVDAAVRALVRDPAVGRLCVIGISLGGSMLLKLAGEWADAAPEGVSSIATLSAPTDFHAVTEVLERTSTYPYRRYVLGGVIRQALNFARHHPERARFDCDALRRVRTIREYDAIVMVPMHGFASVRDYYDRTTAAPWLPAIRVPTLVVHAEDDPIIPGATVRPALAAASAAVQVARTDHGGHAGWFSGLDTSDTWATRRVLEFIGEP
jgi:predicted alpha/beta-fold hydrolase